MRYAILSVLFCALALVVGCGQREDTGSGDSAGVGSDSDKGVKGTVGLSVMTLTNPFFMEIADSLTAEAKKHGYEVIVTSGEFDPARQQNQVKDFIVKKVSVIVLTPCDSKAIGPAIQEANAAGIPVFTADVACLAPGAKVVSHIATDNYQGGRLAAKAMKDVLGGRGKVAIIDHPVVESVMMRTKGFEDEMAELNKQDDVDITIVAKLPGGGVKDQGYKVAQDLIQSQPDLNGIFAINDPSGLGAVAALEEAGKLSAVSVVCFDGQPEARKAILDGKVYADPVQFPDKIGVETFNAILKHLDGEVVPGEILIPTELYYKADAEKDDSLR